MTKTELSIDLARSLLNPTYPVGAWTTLLDGVGTAGQAIGRRLDKATRIRGAKMDQQLFSAYLDEGVGEKLILWDDKIEGGRTFSDTSRRVVM